MTIENSRPSTRCPVPDETLQRYVARARFHARRYARCVRAPVTVADLVSAGYAGLADALARCEVGSDERLDAFVNQRIRGAILDELRRNDPLSRDQRTLARKLNAATRKLGEHADGAQLAAEAGVDLSTLRANLSRMQSAVAISAASGDDDRLDSVGDDRSRPDSLCESRERAARLDDAMGTLSPRHRDVLRRYYDGEQTLREIAGDLGLTESRVWQIQREAIQKLRVAMADC